MVRKVVHCFQNDPACFTLNQLRALDRLGLWLIDFLIGLILSNIWKTFEN
jgi:hypothetical protein